MSNSPPLTHGDQIPHPVLEDSDNQIPSSPGKRCQMPGVCLGGRGGMLKLRFDRYITLVTDRGPGPGTCPDVKYSILEFFLINFLRAPVRVH